MTLPLEQIVHRCEIKDGQLSGRSYVRPVTGADIEFRHECPYCGEPLALTQEILAAIYDHLTDPPTP